jgi:phosphonate transport system ATP-binding protein
VRGPGPRSSERVVAALAQVGLADRIGDRVADLSGGQQQRVAVARVLLQRPQLILADEPVSAVDPVTGRRVLGALLELADEHATLLVSLHDVALARRFPRIIALRGGAVVFDGRPEELEEAAVEEIYSEEPLDQARPGGQAPATGRHCDPTAVIREREGYGLRAR